MFSCNPANRECIQKDREEKKPHESIINSLGVVKGALNRQFDLYDRKYCRMESQQLKSDRRHAAAYRAFHQRVPEPKAVDTNTIKSYQEILGQECVHLGKSWTGEDGGNTMRNPTNIIYTPPDCDVRQFGLCQNCIGYLTKDGMPQLPPGWQEYHVPSTTAATKDNDDERQLLQPYYYHAETGDITWTPPPGVSESSNIVFQKHQSIYYVCKCKLSRDKRRKVLRKLQDHATALQDSAKEERRLVMTSVIENQ